MELIDIVPEFNLYEEYWNVYTRSDVHPPNYISDKASVERCIIGEGSEIHGTVKNSVIGSHVWIEDGAVVENSIIMNNSHIGKNTRVDKAIIAEDVEIGQNAVIGTGEMAPSTFNPKVYAFELVTIGEHTVIPDGVSIGRNTAIIGVTKPEEYPDGKLPSGGAIIHHIGAQEEGETA